MTKIFQRELDNLSLILELKNSPDRTSDLAAEIFIKISEEVLPMMYRSEMILNKEDIKSHMILVALNKWTRHNPSPRNPYDFFKVVMYRAANRYKTYYNL